MYSYKNVNQIKLTIIVISIAFTLTTIEIISSHTTSAEEHIKQRSIQDLINRNDSFSAYLQGTLKFTDCDISYNSINGTMNFTNCKVKNE